MALRRASRPPPILSLDIHNARQFFLRVNIMMDPDYDLFVTVVDAGGLSAAARKLGISPAMVSKRLARLEQRLGTRLIHRSTRKMALTPQGERLRADLGAIFAPRPKQRRRRTKSADAPVGGGLRPSAAGGP